MVSSTLYGGGSTYIWGEICYNERTDLVVLSGKTMNALRYRDMVLEPLNVPMIGALEKKIVLIDNNDRRGAIVNQQMEHHGIS